MDVLIIDNGDPAIDQLSSLLHQLGVDAVTYANDEIELDDVRASAPKRIIISTGDELPADAGITLPLIREIGIDFPLLGIGLGMVCIAVAFGSRASAAASIPVALEHDGASILLGLPSPLSVASDPALVFELRVPPPGLWTMAWSNENQIMGLAHATLPMVGLVALPASPDHARHVLANFLALPPHV